VRRRNFITLLGGAAAWPVAARGQQPKLPVIGFLYNEETLLGVYANRIGVFRQGLGETGYVEGQNVLIEYRSAEGQIDRLPTLAADLVARQVAVIVVAGIPAARAAQAATATIPIVFSLGADPVAFGLVTSLNRPGGNITGVSSASVELGPKRLELLHELIPGATTVGLLVNPSNPNSETLLRDAQAAARTLGLQIYILHASTERDFDAVFASLVQLRAPGLVISNAGLFIDRSERLAALALRHAVPAIFQYREFAAAGGLMSYGTSSTDLYRYLGVYTGRILKAEKPEDLPVHLTTRVELIINLKTAKALGLTVPLTLLGRADEVIE
jgi:putative ABC transport system substrate-binding protein